MDKLIAHSPSQFDHQLLLQSILDSLPTHICVIDCEGTIIYANRSWYSFAENNGGAESLVGVGVNYLAVTDASAQRGDAVSAEISIGIKQVLEGRAKEFYFEYPCDSPSEKRWFMFRVRPLNSDVLEYFVVDHHDITERKLAELKAEALTRIDPLTGIANRRHLLEHAEHEWRRCKRGQLPITIALIDCDNFKFINDTFGHQAGDDVLKTIAHVLDETARRPSDLASRFGGDEFLLAYGGGTSLQVEELITSALEAIKEITKNAPFEVTVSVGIAQALPSKDLDMNELIRSADMAMYQAKQSGKNKIVISRTPS
ncbi:MAG: diguanylate cyclase [Pontibacterium sp.]